MAISREVRSWPARTAVSPRARSDPAKAMNLPGAAGRRTSTSVRPSSRRTSVCSTIATASAPRGSMPPVAISVAVPSSTAKRGSTPGVRTSALRRRAFGVRSLAPTVSAARTAKPSTFERSKLGTSTPATTGSASTRLRAWERGRRSLPKGHRLKCRWNRAIASSRLTTSRNCSWRARRLSAASISSMLGVVSVIVHDGVGPLASRLDVERQR